ncbi:recombinase family protein [Blastococcus sp. SYSU D00813]
MTTRRSNLRAVPQTAPRAVLYLRQSVSRDDSISLELQETACRDYCARRSYTVTEVIADPGISGRTWNRPGVQRTLDLVESGAADVIVLWRWSRLSRSRKDWAVAVDRVEVAGGAIESATEPVDVSTAAGRLQRGMLAELAAWESEVKGEQWKETHARRRSKGLPHGGGYRPGYLYLEDKTYAPDPETAPLVAEAYRRFIDGVGLRTLAEWLTAVGVPSRATGTAWTHRGVGSLLDNGFAAGLLHVHDPTCGCRNADTCRRRTWIDGAHQPVITAKTWTAYRRERERRATTPRRLLTPTTTLAGLVRCGACGYGMRVKQSRGPGVYYKCETAGCPQPSSVVKARAEEAALQWLTAYAHDVEHHAALDVSDQAARVAGKAAVTRLARAVTQLDSELTKLTREYTRGVIPEAAYTATSAQLAEERSIAQAALDQAITSTPPNLPSRRDIADLVADWPTVAVATRNRICRPLLRVVVTRGAWRSDVQVVPAWEWQPPF